MSHSCPLVEALAFIGMKDKTCSTKQSFVRPKSNLSHSPQQTDAKWRGKNAAATEVELFYTQLF